MRVPYALRHEWVEMGTTQNTREVLHRCRTCGAVTGRDGYMNSLDTLCSEKDRRRGPDERRKKSVFENEAGFYNWWPDYIGTEKHPEPKTVAKAAWKAARTR